MASGVKYNLNKHYRTLEPEGWNDNGLVKLYNSAVANYTVPPKNEDKSAPKPTKVPATNKNVTDEYWVAFTGEPLVPKKLKKKVKRYSWKPGDKCKVDYDGMFYQAEVKSVCGREVCIWFKNFDEKVVLDVNDIHPIRFFANDDCGQTNKGIEFRPGDAVNAMYYQDGNLYTAIVQEIGDDFMVVFYEDYDTEGNFIVNSEHIFQSHLYPDERELDDIRKSEAFLKAREATRKMKNSQNVIMMSAPKKKLEDSKPAVSLSDRQRSRSRDRESSYHRRYRSSRQRSWSRERTSNRNIFPVRRSPSRHRRSRDRSISRSRARHVNRRSSSRRRSNSRRRSRSSSSGSSSSRSSSDRRRSRSHVGGNRRRYSSSSSSDRRVRRRRSESSSSTESGRCSTSSSSCRNRRNIRRKSPPPSRRERHTPPRASFPSPHSRNPRPVPLPSSRAPALRPSPQQPPSRNQAPKPSSPLRKRAPQPPPPPPVIPDEAASARADASQHLPPMPQFADLNDDDDDVSFDKKALTNMLVSWFMSGYHTGYYRGLCADVPSDNGEDDN